METFLKRLFARQALTPATRKAASRRPIRNRPRLEHLEDRLAPATHIWTGLGATATWSNTNNWLNNAAPVVGEADQVLVFDTNLVNSGHANPYTTVDDIAGLSVAAVEFAAPAGPQFTTGGTEFSSGGPMGPAGYTILGTTGLTINQTGATTPAGIVVDNGVTSAAIGGVTETIGASLPLTLVTAANITVKDPLATVIVNGTINNNGFALDVANTNSTGANSTQPQSGPAVDLNGVISGAGALQKDGVGTLLLVAANTYTGNTTINNGVVIAPTSTAAGASSLGASGNTTTINGTNPSTAGQLLLMPVSPAAGVSITQASYHINSDATGGAVVADGGVDSLGASGVVVPDSLTVTLGATSGSTLMVGGTISGAGGSPGLLQTDGPGTLEFGGANTYHDSTSITGNGILQLDTATALGAAGRTTTVTSGSTLLLNFTGTLDENLILNGSGVSGLGALNTLGNNNPIVTTTATPTTITLGSNATIGVTLANTALTINGRVIETTSSQLSKVGPGTLVLSNAGNNYSGGTDILGGIVQVMNAALGTGVATVEEGAALQLSGGFTLPNNVVLNALGAVQGTDFPANATGSLENVNGGNAISGTVTLSSIGAAQADISVDSGSLTLSNAVQGPNGSGISGGIVKSGTGTLIFSGANANTYTGTTSVNDGLLELSKSTGVIAVQGPLVIGDNLPNTVGGGIATASDLVFLLNNDQIASTASVTINADGLLDLDGFNQTVGPLNMIGGIIVGGGTLTLTKGLTATGLIDAAGNTHEAEILGGNLALNTILGGGTTTITVNPTAGTPFPDIIRTDLFINSVIENDSVGSTTATNLRKAGTGDLFLTGANTYTGTTEIVAGTIKAESGAAGGATSALGAQSTAAVTAAGVTVDNGASLELSSGVNINKPLTLNGTGFDDPVGAGQQLAALEDLTSDTWAGPITLNDVGTAGSLAAASTIGDIGPGTLTLTGAIGGAGGLNVLGGGSVIMTNVAGNTVNAPNTYSGKTWVETGATLTLDKFFLPTVGGTTPLTAVLGPLVILGGTVNVELGTFPSTPSNPNSGFEIGTLSTLSTATITSGGVLSLGANVQQSLALVTMSDSTIALGASGMLQLTNGLTATTTAAGANTVTGTDAVAQLLLGGAQTFTVNPLATNPAATVDLNVTAGLGQLAGMTGSLTKTGTGVMELSSANSIDTYTGGTQVSQGTLLLNVTAASATSGAAIPGGTTLTISSGAVVRDLQNFQISANVQVPSALASVVVNGTLDVNGHSDVVGGATALTLNVGTVTLGAGGQLFLLGNVSSSGASTISGGTLVLDGPAGPTARTFDVAPGSVLTVSSVVGQNAGIAGQIGALTKSDGGTLVLTATDTYTGATAITGGTLQVDGSIATSSGVTIAPASSTGLTTLSGIGTVPAVMVGNGSNPTVSGSNLAPGDGATTGVLHSGAVTFNAGSNFTTVLNGTLPGSGYSQLQSSGAVALGTGNATLNVSIPGDFNVNTSFDIIHAAGGLTGTFANIIVSTGQKIQVTYTANDVFLTVLVATTMTSAVTGPSTLTFGQAGTYTATVTFSSNTTGTPGGTITFIVDGQPQPNPTQVSSVYNAATHTATASITLSNLSVGQHTITAAYSGDPNNAASASPTPTSPTVTVDAVTSTTVTSSQNPSAPGQSVTFTAVVQNTSGSGGTPAGSVQFEDNGSPIGSPQPLSGSGNSAAATFTTSTLPNGTNDITAVYIPTTNSFFTSNPSNTLVQTVELVVSSVVTATPATTTFGQTVTLSDVVANTSGATAPTGSVVFIDSATGLAVPGTVSATSSGNTTTYTETTSSLAVGIHTITGNFTGTGGFGNSTGTATETVNAATVGTTTAVTATPPNTTFGQMVTLTATVSPSTGTTAPTGNVVFVDSAGGNLSGPVTSSPGANNSTVFTETTSSLAVGTHTITANFTGTGGFGNSTGTATETVGAAPTSALVSSNNNPAADGSPVMFTVTVTNTAAGATTAPTGMVQFMDGSTPLGTAQTLTPGAGTTSTASISTSSLTVGMHQITAVYTPANSSFQGGTSPALNQTVNPTAGPAFPAVLKTTSLNGGVGFELDVFNTATHTASNVQSGASQATWSAITTVRDGSGNEDIFAIIAASPGGPSFVGSVWEYQVSSGGTISLVGENSPGDFLSISAATNASGQAVVFGVVNGGTVYEQNPAGAGNMNWTNLNAPTTMASVSAITPAVGANAVVYAISTAGDVYEDVTTFTKVSTSSGAATISAGLTAAGHAEVFVLGSDGSLVQISPDLAGGVPQTLSGAHTILDIAAGSTPDEVFAVTSGNGFTNALWVHTNTNSWTPLDNSAPAGHSTPIYGQISATSVAGSDEVFSALTDGTLGEFANGSFTDFSSVTGVDAVSVPH